MEITICSAEVPDRTVAELRQTLQLRPGVNKSTRTLDIPAAKHWSPASPHLYVARVRVLEAQAEQRKGPIRTQAPSGHASELDLSAFSPVSDEWSARFGMREFTIRDKRFQLNGKAVFLKATFFEGLYPTKIAYPDSRDMAAREIQLAKDAGFNMIRPWRRPPAPMWLDLADEMGVLVVGSPVLECMRLPLSTPYLPSRVEQEIRQTILRDRNRACVVQWELFNELHRPILKQMMRPMAVLARELDPTRLILDESGGWAFGAQMYVPGEYEPTKFNDIHTYPGPLINDRLYDGFLTIGMTDEEKKASGLSVKTPGRNVLPGLMSFVSELGYGSLPNLIATNERFRRDGNPLTPAYRYHHRLEEDQKRVLRESGFDKLYPNFEQFCLDQQSVHGAANKRMIEAVRSNPNVSGYCIHALTAGDWILGAGLIDLWRQPKTYAYDATRAANQPRILSIRTSPRNVYAARGIDIEVIGINELEAANAKLTVQVVSPDEQVVFNTNLDARWKEGVSRLLKEHLNTRTLRGRYTVRATVSAAEGSVVAETAREFDVFSDRDLAIPDAQIAVLDTTGTLSRFLEKTGIEFEQFAPSTPQDMPVFVTDIKLTRPEDRERFTDLYPFVAKGGTAVYVQGVGMSLNRDKANRVESPGSFFTARVEAARGLWTCIPHLVHEHPIFADLPTGGMMREIYENVWAFQTLRDLDGEAVVASIGFDWFSQDHKMHYSGPGESWWGADLAVAPCGDGRCVVSQLRIIENLGKDPVADKLLINLIGWTTGDGD